MKALVIGTGISGKAAINYLLSRRWDVIAHDRARSEGVPCEVFTDHTGIDLEGISLIVLSPGIALNHPLVERAKAANIPVIGEAELAFREMKNRVIGITGTNGKSTLVSKITHVLNATGQKAIALGNIGTALSSALDRLEESTIVVAEMSSFQLETLNLNIFSSAAIINVTPDHLDRHGTMEGYCKAKLQIASALLPGGKLFVGNKVIEEFGYLFQGIDYQIVMDPDAFALEICKDFSVTEEAFQTAVASFKSLDHRLEYVGTIRGIACYNDSKGTNIDATMYAVDKIKENIILLAGGRNKGASFLPWRESFRGKVKSIIVFGEAKGEIHTALQGAFDIHVVQTMREAFEKGLQLGKEGDNLVLSPGCASLDQFANFEERGKIFIRMVADESKRYNTCCSLH